MCDGLKQLFRWLHGHLVFEARFTIECRFNKPCGNTYNNKLCGKTLNNKLCGNTYLSKHIERIEELVDEVKELHNNNLARVEEEVLNLKNLEVPINADKERDEEVRLKCLLLPCQ